VFGIGGRGLPPQRCRAGWMCCFECSAGSDPPAGNIGLGRTGQSHPRTRGIERHAAGPMGAVSLGWPRLDLENKVGERSGFLHGSGLDAHRLGSERLLSRHYTRPPYVPNPGRADLPATYPSMPRPAVLTAQYRIHRPPLCQLTTRATGLPPCSTALD